MATIKPSGLSDSPVPSSFEAAEFCYSSTETGVTCDSFVKSDERKQSSHLIFKQENAQKQAGSGLSQDALAQAERYQRWQQALDLSIRYQRWQEALELSIRYAEWQRGLETQSQRVVVSELPLTNNQKEKLERYVNQLQEFQGQNSDGTLQAITDRAALATKLSAISDFLEEVDRFFTRGMNANRRRDEGVASYETLLRNGATEIQTRLRHRMFELFEAEFGAIPRTAAAISSLTAADIDSAIQRRESIIQDINAAYGNSYITLAQQYYLKAVGGNIKLILLAAKANKLFEMCSNCNESLLQTLGLTYEQLRQKTVDAIREATEFNDRIPTAYQAALSKIDELRAQGLDEGLVIPPPPQVQISSADNVPERCGTFVIRVPDIFQPTPVPPEPTPPPAPTPPPQPTPLQRYTLQINEEVPHDAAVLAMTRTGHVNDALDDLTRQERAVRNADGLSDADRTTLRALLAGYERQLKLRKLEIQNTQEAVNDLNNISTLISRLAEVTPFIGDPILGQRASAIQELLRARLNTLFTEKINALPTNAMAVGRQRDVDNHLEAIETLRPQITDSGLDQARRDALLARLMPIETSLRAVSDNWTGLQEVRRLATQALQKIDHLVELVQAYEAARSALNSYGHSCTDRDEFNRLERATQTALTPIAAAKTEADRAIAAVRSALGPLNLPAEVGSAIQIPAIPAYLSVPNAQTPLLAICVEPIRVGATGIPVGQVGQADAPGASGAVIAVTSGAAVGDRLGEHIDDLLSPILRRHNKEITLNIHYVIRRNPDDDLDGERITAQVIFTVTQTAGATNAESGQIVQEAQSALNEHGSSITIRNPSSYFCSSMEGLGGGAVGSFCSNEMAYNKEIAYSFFEI